MTGPEKRKFIRYDSLHLLDYLEIDDDGNTGVYSMGRTIDVSIDGIKLETTHAIKANTKLLITLGIEDDLVDLEATTTHSTSFNNRYISGASFIKVSRDGRRVIAKYVEAFRHRKLSL